MMKRFFLRRLRTYIKLLMIPTVIVLLVCSIYVFQSHSYEIENKTKRSVQGMYEGIETMFQDAIYPYNLVLFNAKFSIGMRKLLNGEAINYLEHSYVYNTTQLIQSTINTHPYISSTYFILDDYDNFYTSDKGVKNLDTYEDKGWYKTLQELEAHAGKFTQYRTVSFGRYETKEYVSVYQKMPVGKGSIVVNIDYKDFVEKLENLPDSNELLYVVNHKGEEVISIPQHKKLSEEELKELAQILAKVEDQRLQAEWIALDGHRYCISTIENTEYGITYVSLIPFKNLLEAFWTIGIWLVLLIIVEILVITLICYWITRESFGHISQLLTLFSNAEQGIYPDMDVDEIKDEYDVLLMNIVKFFLNTTFLQSQLEQQKLKKESAEIAALQLQISPHFLFNTLQSLNFEIEKQIGGYKQPNIVIEELSDILKFALNSARHFVTFAEELEILKKYVGIQKFRFKDNVVFYYEVAPDIMDICVPKMILQPLIENSISHGILPTKTVGFIKLKAFARQGKLWVTVLDTGIGISPERIAQVYENIANPESQNIGLTNVNRRLILNYGNEAALKIMSRQGKGTCITFKIALLQE